jgi:hypothetical protein
VWLPSLTGLAWREAGGWPVPGYVKDELHGFLTCGILCFGFARVKPDPQAPGRTTRTAADLTRSWPAHRLGRARASPLLTSAPFRRRQTSCRRSTSTASDRCRTLGIDEAARRPDSVRLRAHAGKTPLQGERHAVWERPKADGGREHAAHEPLISSLIVAEMPLAKPSLMIRHGRAGAGRSGRPSRAILRAGRPAPGRS